MPSASRYRFVIWAFLILSQVFWGISYMAISPLFPMIMEDFRVNRATVSLMISVVTLINALGSIPIGIIAARIGTKRAFGIGAFLMGATVFSRFSQSFGTLLITRIVYGIGGTLRYPPIAGLVMQWFRGRELTLVNAINSVSGSAGISLGMLIVPWLATSVGWKMVLTVTGLVLLVFAFAWLFLGREATPDASSPDTIGTQTSIKVALKSRVIWMLVIAATGPTSFWIMLNSWLPTYYTEVFQMSLTKASNIVALLNFLGIPACLLGGILPMRVGLRRPFLIIPGIIVGFAGFGTFLFNNPALIYISAIILGVCVWIYWPTLMTICMELPGMTPRLVVVTIAVVTGITNLGSFAAPLIVGHLADTTGSYTVGFSIWAIFSWSLLVGGLMLPETGPRARHRQKAPE